jgi:hypothetical protein
MVSNFNVFKAIGIAKSRNKHNEAEDSTNWWSEQNVPLTILID